MTTTLTEEQASAQEEFVGRIFGATIGALELLTIDLGQRLSLFSSLDTLGDANPADLAKDTGIYPRYAREWLEQQACAGILEVALDGDDDTRRYRIPAAHRDALLEPTHPAYVSPLGSFIAPVAGQLDALEAAFRSGAGVPWAAYCAHDVQGAFNRPMFVNELAQTWLPGVPGLVDRLAEPGTKVAEIGCGEGWAAIELAKAFPSVTVHGFDLDDASIATARKNAADEGVADRVAFEVKDASDEALAGQYHLVAAIECLHDMSNPVDALRTMRRLRAPDGVVLVVDELTPDEFVANGDDVTRLFYGASVLLCLPNGMAEQPSAETGTVMRAATVRDYAQQAGFADIEIVPVEHMLFRFYRLVG